jgi:hypothetical protein
MKFEVQPGYHVATKQRKEPFYPGEKLDLDDKEGKRLIDAGVVKEATEGGAKGMNAADTIALVQKAALEELDALATGEPRKTVIEAIDKRRAELTPTE